MGHHPKFIADQLNGEWLVVAATRQWEGLEAVHGETLDDLNEKLADFLPEGEKVLVFDETHAPMAVIGRHRIFD